MQEQAHPARMCGRLSMPLTLLAQPTGATITEASLIHDTQAAIGLAALFGGRKLLQSLTAQGAIGLAEKVS